MTSTDLSRKQLNFAQISIVCVDILKQCLIDILDIHIKPTNLGEKIRLCSSLTAGKDKLNSGQRDLCCPLSPCVPDYSKFDVTLLYRLIRNLCPTLKPSNAWGKEPKTTDLTIGDDIERIRLFRNKHYAHAYSAEIPDSEFIDLWNEGKSLIHRLQNFTTAKGCKIDYGLKLTNISGRMIKYEEYTSYVDLFRAISIDGNVEVTCGDTAHFKADIRLEESACLTVSWERVYGSVRKHIDISCEKYRGSTSSHLNIHFVCKEDEGEYQAVISKYIDQKIVSNIGYLRTQGELPRLENLKVSTAKEEICIHYSYTAVENSPRANDIKWTKNKTPLDLTSHKYCGGGLENSYLTISCPTKEDRGEYSCTVSNAVGSVSREVILEEPSAKISTNTPVVHGLETRFSCLISSCPSPEQIEWQQSCDGNTFYRIDTNELKFYGSNEDPSSPVLCLPKTTFDDQQFYRIVVRNKLGECISDTHFLKVTGNRPNITNAVCTTKDRSVRLNCGIFLYDKSPALQDVYWTKNEQRLDIQGSGGKYSGGVSPDDPSLTINHVNEHDAGNYQLTASNSIGPTKSDVIVLGVPDVVLKKQYKNEDGSQCFMVRIKSNPAPFFVQWSMKDKKSGSLQQINVNDDKYKGTSYSFPRPMLVVKHKDTLENYSFRIEVENVIGFTEKIIPDETNPIILISDDNTVNVGNLNRIYERSGRNIRFGKVFDELAEKFPEAKISRLKDLIQNSCEIEDVTSLNQAKSARDCFRILRSENIFTPEDVICLQYLLKMTECEELERKCIEYAKMQNALYYYEKPPDNGYKNVHFHIVANIRDYSTKNIIKVRETVAAIVGCTIEEVHESGYLHSASFILVLSIKNSFVNKLLALNRKNEEKLSKLCIDYFKIDSTTIRLEFSREKCKVKLLERGKNEIMFAETKEFQAMYKNVRNQVQTVENDEGKVAMDIKASFKQQKDGVQDQAALSTSSDKSKMKKLSEWEELSRETEQIREQSLEERQTVTNKTIEVHRDLETFLGSNDYDEDLRKELKKSNPDYQKVISNRIRDLQQVDHGLVVSGETSAGKSTLINKILGKRIFKGKILESTSTICKIRNSDKIRVITEKMSGEKEEQDFTEECDLGTEEGVTMLRDFLEKRTDRTCISSDHNIRCVDIGFPIHFLKANTILVDTPGIGGSGEVTHKLKEYLPNALSFIFVINASSAGGMQQDRLPEILEELVKLILNSEMPSFHPESVIFLTNKWDLVELQAEDEEEVTQVWKRLRSDLQRRWPSVKEEHIFRLNLKEVSEGKRNASTKTFEDFLKVLESMSKRAKNLRILQHLRFLQTILRNVSKGLDARIELVNKSEAEQSMLIKEHREKVEMLTRECKKFREDYLKKTKDTIKIIVQDCEAFMSTSAGKYDILNPTGRKKITEVEWNKTDFEKEIRARVDLYVVEYLQSDRVLEKFKKIGEEINEFRQKIISSLEEMESEWARLKPIVEETESSTFLIQLGLFTSPVWIAALAFGFGIPAAVFGGILFAVSSFFGWVTKTSKEIDDEYNRCIKAVPKRMHTLLENKCGSNISTMIEKVTKELFQCMEALKERLNQISEKRNQIIANREVLLSIDTKINTMEKCVLKLREDLNS